MLATSSEQLNEYHHLGVKFMEQHDELQRLEVSWCSMSKELCPRSIGWII